ncbi:MAG: DUF3857 and transglutaminase domain-containing protein [Proteobacteria bacterium]|nr:DUF3857 and transglutaminase domain-containing protein [Pseudomonadota bacterium]
MVKHRILGMVIATAFASMSWQAMAQDVSGGNAKAGAVKTAKAKKTAQKDAQRSQTEAEPSTAGAELLSLMKQAAIAGSHGGEEAWRKSILNKQTTGLAQRYIDWHVRYDQDMSGKAEDIMPGAVTQFLVSFPFECASMFDFGRPFAPENGFDTSKATDGAMYPALNWMIYESKGNTSALCPQERMANPGFVTLYMATRLISDDAQKAVLEMPSTTPVVAWINGKRVVESMEKGPEPAPKYGEKWSVDLQKGENILVLKVAALEQQPGLYVFFSDENGKPMNLKTDLSTPIVSGALDAVRPAHPEPSVLMTMLRDNSVSIADRALIAREILAPDEAERKINDLLFADIEKTAALSAEELEIAILALDDAGKSMQILKKAIPRFANDPRMTLLYARQMLLTSEEQGDTGIRFADEWPQIKKMVENLQAPVINGISYEPLKRKILALAELNGQQAMTALQSMDLDSCPACETYLGSLVMGSMTDRGQRLQYRNMLQKLWSHQQNASAYLADMLDMNLRRAVSGNDVAAIATALADIQKQVESFFERHPYDDFMWAFWLRVLTAYGLDSAWVRADPNRQDILRQAGFTADAESWFMLYLTQRMNDPGRWVLYAEHCLRTGQLGEAVEAYQMASQLMPQNDTLAERAVMAQKMANHDTAPDTAEAFEKPYIVKDVPGNQDPNATGLVSLIDNRVVRILPNGLASTFNQIAFEIIDEQGLKSVRSMPINYSPTDEKLEIISVTTTKKDGTVRRLYKTSEFNMADESIRMYYDQRQLVIEVPDLAVGDRIEYQFKRTQTQRSSSSVSYFSDVYQLQTWFNRQWSRYTILSPADMPVQLLRHDPAGSRLIETAATLENNQQIRQFEEKNTPRFLPEDKMPGATEVMPFLIVSTFKNWQAIADWFLDLAQSQWKADDAIRSEVARLTEGVTDEFEKLKRIHSFVVKSTRYVALEFGIHGHKPYPAAQVFERRFGDCKDKASLLKVMLKEAGIDSDFVLARTRQNGDISMDLANPYLFDHAILYVPKYDLFLDGTAEFSGTGELPALDQDAWVFILNDNGSYRLIKTPVSKAADNVSHHEWVFDLTQGDRVTYTDIARYTGFFAPSYRERYQIDTLQRERLESELAYNIPGTKVESHQFSDLTNLEASVNLEMQASTSFADIVKTNGNTWLVNPTISTTRMTQMLAPSATRRTPIIQVVPMRFEQSVTLILPPDAQVTLPNDTAETTDFGSYEIKMSKDGNRLTTNVTLILETIKVMPENYTAYLDFLQRYDRKLNTQLAITVESQ